MKSKISGNENLTNGKKDSETDYSVSDIDLSFMGIELVRFDDEDNQESSIKVSIVPFLAPFKQSETIFG